MTEVLIIVNHYHHGNVSTTSQVVERQTEAEARQLAQYTQEKFNGAGSGYACRCIILPGSRTED